jgi:hypothetical protein
MQRLLTTLRLPLTLPALPHRSPVVTSDRSNWQLSHRNHSRKQSVCGRIKARPAPAMATAATNGGATGEPGPASQYQPYLEVALAAAKEAGAAIADAWNKAKTVDTKSGAGAASLATARRLAGQQVDPPAWGPFPLHSQRLCFQPHLPPACCVQGDTDLVTETDRRCEELVLSRIRAAFPDHKFIGEEGSAAQVGVTCREGEGGSGWGVHARGGAAIRWQVAAVQRLPPHPSAAAASAAHLLPPASLRACLALSGAAQLLSVWAPQS